MKYNRRIKIIRPKTFLFLLQYFVKLMSIIIYFTEPIQKEESNLTKKNPHKRIVRVVPRAGFEPAMFI